MVNVKLARTGKLLSLSEVACLPSLFCHFVSLGREVAVDSFEEDSLGLFRILSFRSVFIAVSKIERLIIDNSPYIKGANPD